MSLILFHDFIPVFCDISFFLCDDFKLIKLCNVMNVGFRLCNDISI